MGYGGRLGVGGGGFLVEGIMWTVCFNVYTALEMCFVCRILVLCLAILVFWA